MNKALKIIFAGTPEIAKNVLDKLIEYKFQIDLVLTQPDRPAGRGMKLVASPVKALAQLNEIAVFQPLSFRKNPEAIQKIKNIQADIMIVVAYGLILPQELLEIPKLGCINIHVSLLPRWRGAAPIQRAILAGDEKTGVTIMQMDAGLDTGNILLSHEVTISQNETSASLHEKLANIGAEQIIEFLNNYQKIQPGPHSLGGVTYAEKIMKQEGRLNWQERAELIERKIRGYNPFPGVFSFLDGKMYKFWSASYYQHDALDLYEYGKVIKIDDDGLHIACADNSILVIKEIQEAGSKRKSINVFLQGKSDLLGKIFSSETVDE